MPHPQKLAPAQQLAALCRILGRQGYDDKLAGHISIRHGDELAMWVNPVGMFWREVRARDALLIGEDAEVLQGHGIPNPTIVFHTELHRARSDVHVAIHNHPPFGSIWACASELPPLLDQSGANGGGKAVLYHEYPGAVMTREIAAEQARGYGDADLAILAQHGTLVTADNSGLALVRALSFEWRCQRAWQVARMGRQGAELPHEIAATLAGSAQSYGDMLFEKYVGEELALAPDFLDL